MSKKKSLINYIQETEQRLKKEYGLYLADIHLPTLADCWTAGWSVQDFIEWYAGKYDLQPLSENLTPF